MSGPIVYRELSMDRRSLAALGLTGLAAAATLFPTTSSQAQESKTMPRVISLNGHGEVKARPDMAVINVGVMTQGQTARAALSENTKAMEKVFASLKSAGIEG
jgi:uncharacterized protein YggE